MLALAIRFPAGRFHSTPWGRHVNEAAPEWPPSPWRLLRALVATWKRKLDGHAACPADVVERLLRNLAAPPSFGLPPASTGHARHFMPWFKKGPADRTLVFDAWVALDRDADVVAVWPALDLDPAELRALETLAEHLGFLGRAESWAEARVLAGAEAAAARDRINCSPAEAGSSDAGTEPVRVLCADPVAAFENEYTPKHERAEGRGKARCVISTPIYDPDWHLCLETLELHAQRWSDPPGSRWITYQRRRDCFAIRPSRPARRHVHTAPTVARFVLDAPVLPLLQETLPVAELARRVLMGIYRRIEQQRRYGDVMPDGAPLPRSAVFSGKTDDGRPRAGHAHAHYLPTDEDADGRLDHLTIVAPMGFGPAEIRVLDRVHRLPRESGDPVNFVLLALGRIEDIRAPLLGPATTWISATPFIATRHPKARGRKRDPANVLGPGAARDFARVVLAEQIERLRAMRPELPAPIAIEFLNPEHRLGATRLRPIQFRRYRRKAGDDGGRRPAGAFRIVFPERVSGPLCLGHSSHFGLGLFIPDETRP